MDITKIEIDIADWLDEANCEEAEFADEGALLQEHVRRGWAPLKSGRLAIAARELGRAPDDILPANKMLLNTGAAFNISQAFARRFRKSEAGYEVREFVGGLGDELVGEESEPEPMVPSDTQEASERAARYLEKVVTGHIWSRLAIIADNGGDVGAVVDALTASIAEMVSRLVPEEAGPSV